MKDIKKLLCKNMYEFVKEHINEVEEKRDLFGHPQTFQSLGFKNAKDMLKQIKNDYSIAYWALTELLWWGLLRDYRELFIEEETDDFTVYKLHDNDCTRYFMCTFEINESIEIKEVHKVTKLVEINTWE